MHSANIGINPQRSSKHAVNFVVHSTIVTHPNAGAVAESQSTQIRIHDINFSVYSRNILFWRSDYLKGDFFLIPSMHSLNFTL